MDGHEVAEVVGAIGIFAFITIVVTVTIWQLFATWRAKAALAREDEYRNLAERSVAGQEEANRQLAELTGQLTDLRTRMTKLEHVLTEVE
jgi:type VI protein secretion system component VasK